MIEHAPCILGTLGVTLLIVSVIALYIKKEAINTIKGISIESYKIGWYEGKLSIRNDYIEDLAEFKDTVNKGLGL